MVISLRRPWILALALLGLHLSSCTEEAPETIPYQRLSFSSSSISGNLGAQAIGGSIQQEGQVIQIQLELKGAELNMEGRVSYEGLGRGKGRRGEWKGIWVTENSLVGSYSTFEGTEPLLVHRGASDSLPGAIFLREVSCQRTDGTQTGTVVWQIPPRENMDPIAYWKLLEKAFYRPECSCKGLDQRNATRSTTLLEILPASSPGTISFQVSTQFDEAEPTITRHAFDLSSDIVTDEI